MPSIQMSDDRSMSISDAASALGVTAQTVRNWCAAGCPHTPGGRGRNRHATIRLGEVMDWQVAQAEREQLGDADEDLNIDRDKAREQRLKVIKLERDVRLSLGTLVPVDRIAAIVEEDYQRVRSRLNSIPGRTSIQLASETDVAIVRSILAKELAGALSNLAPVRDVIERADGNPDGSIHDPIMLDPAAIDEMDDEVGDDR
jgi:hypothetical protein